LRKTPLSDTPPPPLVRAILIADVELARPRRPRLRHIDFLDDAPPPPPDDRHHGLFSVATPDV
jgi:hypothetical protein